MIRGEMKGASHNGSMSTVSKAEEGSTAAAVEQDYYVGLSAEVSSSYPWRDVGRKNGLAAGEDEGGGGGRGEEDDDDAELELGLSLGAKVTTTTTTNNNNSNNIGRSNAGGGGGAPWGEYCRILTAKDFPSMVASRGSPISSSSSSASSSPLGGGRGGVVGAGTKRAADSVATEVGSHTPSQVVGWPPIRAYRMNSLVNQSKENSSIDNNNNNSHHKKATGGHTGSIHHNSIKENATAKEFEKKGLVGSTLFVKVKMDGVPIGRKVDLNAHCSYETLALALEGMFHKPSTPIRSAKPSKLLDGSSEFVLTYEDKDGDWMLVGDVPWGMFLNTVKRLRIMRTSDANGLAPRFQSSKVGGLRSNPV